MNDGFIRLATATPAIEVADCLGNAAKVITAMQGAERDNAAVLVLPELVLTGYTCSDLFLSQTLLEGARTALQQVIAASRDLRVLTIVGLPLAIGPDLFNVAAVISDGKLLGLVPKMNIPNYSEFYEARHFSAGLPGITQVELFGQEILLGSNLLFACREVPDLVVGVEICEDLWVVAPPSQDHARAGATVIANLSASDELIGKADYRRLLVKSQSGRLLCAYAYADAGEG
ncbi:MAG: NAD(+) synthase, partial [Eubacteriales bacterium]|nr:NAD(+) synthase [Eubacteriales bacterium]